MGIDACSQTPITPGIVSFDLAAFRSAFPTFASVPDAAIEMNFTAATLLLENSCCSVVKDAPTRAFLLNYVTAHLTALFNGVNGQPPRGTVGRISQATEGSVSVSVELLSQTESASWWQTTNFGAYYWRATAQYRTARYIPPACTRSAFPWDAWPE